MAQWRALALLLWLLAAVPLASTQSCPGVNFGDGITDIGTDYDASDGMGGREGGRGTLVGRVHAMPEPTKCPAPPLALIQASSTPHPMACCR